MKKKSCIILLYLFAALFICKDAQSSGRSFQDIVNGVNAKFDQIKTMSANIVRRSKKDSTIVEESWNYYYKRPDKLKVEYLLPTKRFLSLSDNKFVEYIPEAKKARVVDLSKYGDDERAQFYRQVFSRVSIVGIRLGNVEKGDVTITDATLDDLDAELVQSKDPDYQFWVEPGTSALLKHVIFNKAGEIIYQTRGSDFKRYKDSFLLPQRISIMLREEEGGELVKSEMFLKNLRINDGIKDDFFNLILSNDVEIIK